MEGSNFTQIKQQAKTASNVEAFYHLNNIQAEQELLGAILINNETYHRVTDIIKDDCFFDPLHQRIFRRAAQLILAGRQASPVTLKEFFDNEPSVIEGLTVSQYMARMCVNATSIINASGYAETIKGLHIRRQAVITGEQLISDALSTDQTTSKEAIEYAQDALDSLTDHGGTRDKTQASIGESALAVISEMKSPLKFNTIPTGLKDLDRALGGGWPRGELTIIAARPSMGKSAFATSTALKAARQGNEVFMFSMEMPHKAVTARCISEMAYTRENPLPYADILSGRVPDHNWDRLESVGHDFADFPLEIDEQRGLTITNIRSRLRRYINSLDREGRKLDLVIIDHVGKIKAEQYQGQRHLELGAITEELAVLAGDFNVPVIALCQLNRAVEGRDNKRPGLGDLRESGRIEEDANCVISLHRPAYYLERIKHDDPDEEAGRLQQLGRIKNVLEATILKQRNGICRPVELWCDMATNAIGNRGRA